MSKRLQELERKRQRLEEALADDPRWQALHAARPKLLAGVPVEEIPDVDSLAENELVLEYLEVMDAIKVFEEGQQSADQAPSDTPGRETAFRTRVNVKAPAAGSEVRSERQEAKKPSTDETLGGGGSLEVSKAGKQPGPTRIDDLTIIRRIDRQLAKRLNDEGVWSYDDIANWDRHEVRRVRDALDLGKRIWRENWIEQAALRLQARGAVPEPISGEREAPVQRLEPQSQASETDLRETVVPAAVLAAAVVVSEQRDPSISPTGDEATSPSPSDQALLKSELPASDSERSDAVGPPASQIEASHDDQVEARQTIKVGRRPSRLPAPAARRFAYIQGVSETMAEALRGAGVMSLSDIANWTRSDVRWFQAILGDEAHISSGQWIEQATLLSRGTWTRYALRVVGGETRLLVERPQPIVVTAQSTAIDIGSEPAGTETVEALPAAEASPPDPVETSDLEPAALADETNAVVTEAADMPEQDVQSVEFADPEDRAVVEAGEAPARRGILPTVEVKTASAEPVQRYDPMRSLTTAIALGKAMGKIKRPPPNLGGSSPQPTAPTRSPESPTLISREEPAEPQAPSEPPVVPEPLEPRPSVASQPTVASTAMASPPSLVAALGEVEQEAPVDEGAFDVGLVDDWSDAEALVIKRVEQPVPVERVTEPMIEEVTLKRPPQASVSEPAQEDLDAAGYSDAAEEDLEDLQWSGEAEVQIVSRRSSEAPEPAMPVDQELSAAPASAPVVGYVPRIATRQVVIDDEDDLGVEHVPYGASVDEATVTIIRAEANEADASIIPSDVANDETAEDAETGAKKPKFGARFLKALTGDQSGS